MPKRKKVINTYYGPVDASELEKLRGSFNTLGLLAAVDHVDELVAEATGEDGLRDSLLRLHGMAHHVINGAPAMAMPDADITIPILADEVVTQIEDAIDLLKKLSRAVSPLKGLAPEEDV